MREVAFVDAGKRIEAGGHAVAEGDGAGLIKQQGIDVARRFDGAAGGGDDVEAHQAVHAGDADGREQAADRRRDQADQQRGEHGDREIRRRIFAEADQGDDRDQEDQGQAREQNVERDLVRRLAALCPFNQRDHAVEEGLPRHRR